MKARLLRPAALAVVVALTACGGAEERKAEHLKKAIGLYEQSNPDKAALEFKNVLQIDPKSAQPYYYLGRIEEDKKNYQQAFGYLQKAVELDPNYRDAQLRLAKYLLMGRDIDKAQAMLAPVAQERPADFDVRMLQVAIANAKGDHAGAIASLQAMVAEKPSNAEPYAVLALLLAQQSKVGEAEDVLKSGLATNPKSTELMLALIRFYDQLNRPEQVEQALKSLIAAEPDKLPHRVALYQFYAKQNRWGEAEAALRTATKDFPDNLQTVLAIAEFYGRRGDPARAESELRAGLTAHPKALELHTALATLLERGKKPEQAEQLLKDFIAGSDDDTVTLKAKVALAELLARHERPKESEELVDAVLKENPSDRQALLTKGRLALLRKNPQDAIAAFRSILKDQPDATDVLTLLASAFQMDGKPTLVQENLERAVKAKPEDFALRRNLLQFLVQQKNLSLAMDQVNDYLKGQPNDIEALSMKADLLARNQQGAALETALNEMKVKFPTQPVGPFRLGSLYQSRGQHEAALAEFDTALQRAPGAYEPLKALVTELLEQKHPDQALARLTKTLADNPNNTGAHQLLGSLHLTLGRAEEGLAELNKAIALTPTWLPPYLTLGAYYEKDGKLDEALAVYQKAQAVAGEDLEAKLGLDIAMANALERSRKPDQAEKIYRDFIAKAETRPEAAKARLALAEFLGRAHRTADAKAVVGEILAADPRNLQALLTQGKLAMAEKKAPEAVTAFQAALELQPEMTEALTLLAAAQQQGGETGKVQQTLEQAVKASPADFTTRRNLVQLLLQQNNPAQALAQAEDYLKVRPGSLDGLNLKAELLALNKQNDAAVAVLQEIRRLYPDNAAAALRLGSYYLNTKAYDKALAEYGTARRISGNAYEAVLGEVTVHMEMHKPDKALALIKKILADNPKHPGAYQVLSAVQFSQKHSDEGIQALNKAIELKPDWMLPYANLGGYYEKQGQTESALAVYRKALGVAPTDITMQLSVARVYENSNQHDKAIEQYETILKSAPDNLLAINNLASLLSMAPDQGGNLNRALELAKRLDASDEPAFRDTLAWLYHLTGDTSKAVPLQAQAVEKSPQTAIFQYHLGMMYAKQGDKAKAREHLGKALEGKAEFVGIEEAKAALKGLN